MKKYQHIKNFRLVDIPKYGDASAAINIGSLFLESEDGQDWYECQALFSPDTAKIQYDSAGIVWGVINNPVPQRDNVYAVSMLWPVNMSVVEMDISMCPADCKGDGTWRYNDGSIEKIPVDYITAAQREKNKLMVEANEMISTLQDAVDIGIATEDETVLLLAWKKYRVLLSRVDCNQAPDIEWPEKP
ncbi:tail fiber assembly protein [Citrobacter portucalensis]|uniref:tail fiber assembly protein n=1 Tax=Citrobacter portucalensis TaxID=1639133 RepID=UPI00226B2E63|nr:tail fiber assembly protein [Citrobacter portucalensis]MCX8983520.1 tail fiber assembly protein [Citrobacter portucalensis]